MLHKPAKAVAYQFASLGVAALVVLAVSRVYPLTDLVGWLRLHVARWQPWSTLGYPLLHAVCNLLLLPAGVLVIGSGFLFGLWKGFLLALVGHLLGAAGAFWISRTFGRGLIERRLASRPQWRALDRSLEREGWKIVFLSQLSPLLPTSLFNYCYGLTRLRFWHCMGWIALGWSPGMFLYAYLGRLGFFGWQTWQGGAHPSQGRVAVWIGGLVLSLVVSVALGQVSARLLREARGRGEASAIAPPEAPAPEPVAAGDFAR